MIITSFSASEIHFVFLALYETPDEYESKDDWRNGISNVEFLTKNSVKNKFYAKSIVSVSFAKYIKLVHKSVGFYFIYLW